jgi:predicted RNA binding protein YcfA (HicA-like mRNA interferase family)
MKNIKEDLFHYATTKHMHEKGSHESLEEQEGEVTILPEGTGRVLRRR